MKKVSDKYIDKLVLNFNDNDFVKDVIKKTRDIDNYRDVKTTDNSTKCFARNYSK